MGAYRFSMAPNISVPRSRFKMPFNHTTTFQHGKLVPIDCFEILPGDEFKCNLSALIRMSTPVAPIMGNITAHVHAFFVPMRLVWEHTQEFYGENKTSAGYQQTVYSIPSRSIDFYNDDAPSVGSVSHYLGKPITHGNGSAAGATAVSILKERGYYLIWNEYYRAQQLQNPVLITLDDTSGIGYLSDGNLTESNLNIDFSTSCMNVCKEFDYFTACTVAPQYGAAVQLPLGTTAPVVAKYNTPSTGALAAQSPLTLGSNAVTDVSSQLSKVSFTSNASLYNGDLLVDLSQATAASINSIRYAFQVQKWLERANFGSRFFEMLNLHYGVTSPDARLQRPEYLGGFDFRINVDQVVAMANSVQTSTGNDSDLGQTGAISVTGVKGKNLFNKAFVEPGYVYILISTTHERSYAGNILREDLRQDRFDFYFPEFANLGDQIVYKDEIHYLDVTGGPKFGGEFGYQEHWAEYRYRANRVSGCMDPYALYSLDYWNLADKYNGIPSLSNSWIMEDRNSLARSLLYTDENEVVDYIADFYFDYTAIREMPLYTIPGLVDHFGTM